MTNTTSYRAIRLHSTFAWGILAAGLGLAQGCAAGPAFTEVTDIPKDKGLVYVYRDPGFFGGGVVYAVKANGQRVCDLVQGGYCPYLVDPGEVEFSAATESTSSVTVDVKAQKAHYVKGSVNVGFFIGRPHLMIVPEATGRGEITKCKLVQ